jgi:hypothetical protein
MCKLGNFHVRIQGYNQSRSFLLGIIPFDNSERTLTRSSSVKFDVITGEFFTSARVFLTGESGKRDSIN